MRTLLCCALLMMLQTDQVKKVIDAYNRANPPQLSESSPNPPCMKDHDKLWDSDCTVEEYAAAYGLTPAHNPEPVTDVPAIEEDIPDGRGCLKHYEGCIIQHKDRTELTPWEGDNIFHLDWKNYRVFRYSCADKSRVLLTSEDGARHCIKFPQGATQ